VIHIDGAVFRGPLEDPAQTAQSLLPYASLIIPRAISRCSRSTSQTATTRASGWPRKVLRFMSLPWPPVPIMPSVIRSLAATVPAWPKADDRTK
jgi:hypothetical protein